MDRQVLDCASPLALFNGLCPLAPEDRRSPKRWRASAIPALQVVLLLLCLEANAFPPGPYHVLYGTVRDQYGRTLSSSQAHVILQTPLGAQFSASVVPGISLPGVNYLLKVPLDAGVTPDLYQANALVPGAAYKMVVVIGTVTNVPIQMTNSLSVGFWAQSARVDLTLGTDSNGDGIPDAWESFYLASVGLNLPLSLVNANTVVPPNGYTLQQQYLLSIGAPFYDGIDLNNTNQLMADWDGDGMLNAVEYALGTDPNNPSDASAGVTPFVTQVGGSPALELTFKQRVDAALLQIQYIPEVSSDRTNWFTDSSHVAQVGLTAFDTEFNWVTVQDLTPVTPSAPQFIRLRVCYNSIQATSPVWVGSDTTIEGNSGSGSKLTLFSQRMVRSIAYAGKISSVQSTSLTDTKAAWGAGQFGTNGIPAYVEFDSGWSSDIANTASNTLTVADSVAGRASVGDNYRIRPHFTVASLFGTNNETGLIAGPNPAVADNVLVLLPHTQQTLTLFYYSNPPIAFHGWVRADIFAPDPNEVIYPEQGVMVTRIVPSNAKLNLAGPIKTGVTVAPIQPGYNILGTLKSLNSITLSNLNLFTTNNATGVIAGLNPSVSDNLVVVNPNGSVTTYFYYYNPSVFQGWLNAAGFTPSDNAQIPAGSAFLILRQQGHGSFLWTDPAE